jgi:pyrimidine operon attenuation protein/uracil phosphoribosyltransferase
MTSSTREEVVFLDGRKYQEMSRSEPRVVMDAGAMDEALHRIAEEIIANNPDMASVAFLGILSRGRPMAERLADTIAEMTGTRPPVGSLATTLYRDDIRSGKQIAKVHAGETHFDFNIDGLTVVLVDDVLAAGRTTRAALDEVMDYGRPKRVQLACLVDRGQRELPIQPDYLGRALAPEPSDYVSVRFVETDGEDTVLLERRDAAAG